MSDEEFLGYYYPNLDLNVNDNIISANFDFYPSAAEKEAYMKKYGKEYPYKTSSQFRNMVRSITIDYFKLLQKKVDEKDEEWLSKNNFWKAINTFGAVLNDIAGATVLYRGIKCCTDYQEWFNILFNVTGNWITGFVYSIKDEGDDAKWANAKQDKLVDRYTIKDIITDEVVDDVQYGEKWVTNSFLRKHLWDPRSIEIKFAGITGKPNFAGLPEFSVNTRYALDYGLQPKLNASEDDNIHLITRQTQHHTYEARISIQFKYNQDLFELIADEAWDGEREKVSVKKNAIDETYIKQKAISGYNGETGSIRIGAITTDSLNNKTIDGGNFRENCIARQHFNQGAVSRENIQVGGVQGYNIAVRTITNRNILNKSINLRNFSQNLIEEITSIGLNHTLGNLKDSAGTASPNNSYHFNDYYKNRINRAQIFMNDVGFEDYDGNDIIDIHKDNLVEAYRFCINSAKKGKYFKDYNILIGRIQEIGGNIYDGLEEFHSTTDFQLNLYEDTETPDFVINDDWIIVDQVRFNNKGYLCQICGEIKLRENIVLTEFPVTIGRVETYKSPPQSLLFNIFETNNATGEIMYKMAFTQTNELLLLDVVRLDGQKMIDTANLRLDLNYITMF